MFLSGSVVTEASILGTHCNCADRQLLFLSESVVTEVSNFKDTVAAKMTDHTELHKTDCSG